MREFRFGLLDGKPDMVIYLFLLDGNILMADESEIIADVFVHHILLTPREYIMILEYPLLMHMHILDTCLFGKFPLGSHKRRFTILDMTLGESSIPSFSLALDKQYLIFTLFVLVECDDAIREFLLHDDG
jgi:hypothetical protein